MTYTTLKLKEFHGSKVGDVKDFLEEQKKPVAKMPDDLSTLPESMKDGNLYFFFGSSFRISDGDWCVPCLHWSGGRFVVGRDWVGRDWGSGCRVVLCEELGYTTGISEDAVAVKKTTEKIVVYATSKNGEGRELEIGRYDDVEDIPDLEMSMFGKDVVISFEKQYEVLQM